MQETCTGYSDGNWLVCDSVSYWLLRILDMYDFWSICCFHKKIIFIWLLEILNFHSNQRWKYFRRTRYDRLWHFNVYKSNMFSLITFITNAENFMSLIKTNPLAAESPISEILLCLEIKICIVFLENSVDQQWKCANVVLN